MPELGPEPNHQRKRRHKHWTQHPIACQIFSSSFQIQQDTEFNWLHDFKQFDKFKKNHEILLPNVSVFSFHCWGYLWIVNWWSHNILCRMQGEVSDYMTVKLMDDDEGRWGFLQTTVSVNRIATKHLMYQSPANRAPRTLLFKSSN